MPIYHLRCTDQTRHQCEEDVRVRLDIVGLTDEQLECIEQGRPLRIEPAQIEASPLELDRTQHVFLKQHGYLEYRVDIDAICDTCGNPEQTID